MKHKGFDLFIHRDPHPDGTPNSPDDFLVYDHEELYIPMEGFDPNIIAKSYLKGKFLYKGFWVFGVYMFMGDNLKLMLKDDPKSSFKGFYLVRQGKGARDRRNALRTAENGLKLWNAYLRGDIWGYSVEKSGEIYDQQWDYYDYDQCKQDGINKIELLTLWESGHITKND